VDALKDTSS